MGKRILCMILALSLCVSSAPIVSLAVSQETQDQIDKTKNEKEQAEQNLKKNQQEQNKVTNAKAEMENYLADLQQQSKSLNEQLSILNENMEEKEAEIAAKEAEVAEAQETLDLQYEDMKQRIQYMYENEQDTMLGYLTALLTGGISDLLNQIEYAMSINSYDRNMMENFKESKSNLEEQQAELEDEQDALALLKEEVEEKQQQVASQEKEAGTKLSSYNDMIAELEKELGNTEELVKEKTKLLDQLIAKAAEEEEQARIQAAQNAAASMNGVTIIAGDAGISKGSISLSDYELLLLATMIYCEAGNQGTEGQLAVGYVIMNRVRSKLYPNSLEAVLRQSKQFEPVSSGRFDLVLTREQDSSMSNLVTESCWNAARTVVNGTSNVGESLFFRTWAPVPQLITNLQNGGVPYWIIKDHIFYYYWTSYSSSNSSNSDSSGSSSSGSGSSSSSNTSSSGYDADGYDADGYDKNGYDKNGYDKNGYDKNGYDKNGYDKNGYDKNGYDKNGYDKNGYDKNGYDKNGYDKNGYDVNGYNKDGYDKDGYDADGYDSGGKPRQTNTDKAKEAEGQTE